MVAARINFAVELNAAYQVAVGRIWWVTGTVEGGWKAVLILLATAINWAPVEVASVVAEYVV